MTMPTIPKRVETCLFDQPTDAITRLSKHVWILHWKQILWKCSQFYHFCTHYRCSVAVFLSAREYLKKSAMCTRLFHADENQGLRAQELTRSASQEMSRYIQRKTQFPKLLSWLPLFPANTASSWIYGLNERQCINGTLVQTYTIKYYPCRD